MRSRKIEKYISTDVDVEVELTLKTEGLKDIVIDSLIENGLIKRDGMGYSIDKELNADVTIQVDNVVERVIDGVESCID